MRRVQTSDGVVRVGVIGGGFVAQTVHLPHLAELTSRMRIVALAEPSRTARDALARRYGIPRTYADHRELLDRAGADAVVVCSPNGTHADIVLDALAAGVHVLVEKPLCIALSDVDRIVSARDRTGLMVQVGCMKRHDPAYEALLDELPSAAALRHVTTATYDPWLPPWFAPADLRPRDDVPAAVAEAVRRRTAEQVEEAVGTDAPEDVDAFSECFLGALLHDVNAVHGVLERLGMTAPGEVVDAFGDRDRCGGTVRLQDGSRWTMAWLRLDGLADFREEIVLYASDGLRRLRFPAPYLRQAPTVYERSAGNVRGNESTALRSWRESYARQLLHFHDGIVGGTTCRTPPEQARADVDLLTRMYLATMEVGTPA